MSAATQPETAAKLDLKPYIFLNGRCAEALEFYKAVFGGTCDIMRGSDVPPDSQMPGMDPNSIMHASFTSPGVSFFASDGNQTNAVDPDEGNVSLALNAVDAAAGDRVFKALSQGGTVKVPLGPAFWGGRFGNVIDKFGNDWLITSV